MQPIHEALNHGPRQQGQVVNRRKDGGIKF
jgi:hypothetical protein